MAGSNFQRRTDLAVETHEINATQGVDDGIITREDTITGINVTTAEIKPGKGEEMSGKSAGMYYTFDIGRVWHVDSIRFNEIARVVADKISELLPLNRGTVLVAGLGNEDVTPDSIGPRIVAGLVISHHIKELNQKLYNTVGFGDVAAFAPGVLGQTGIESADIIKSVVDTLKPSYVIVIDALSSRRLSRLATTVQLSNTGISPGSGVNNSRRKLDKETLGVPVISIGMPTVVDAATLAYDLLEEVAGFEKININITEDVINRALTENSKNFFISPKETDLIIKAGAKLLSTAINMALHPEIPPEEIPEYL